MEKSSAGGIPELIREIQREADQIRTARRGTRISIYDVARRRLERPNEIIDWAKRDRRWSFTLAEMIKEPGRKPDDLAARLVVAIVRALDEERELLGDEPDLASSEYAPAASAE